MTALNFEDEIEYIENSTVKYIIAAPKYEETKVEIFSTEFPYYKSILLSQRLFDMAENDQEPEDFYYEELMNEPEYWESLFKQENL